VIYANQLADDPVCDPDHGLDVDGVGINIPADMADTPLAPHGVDEDQSARDDDSQRLNHRRSLGRDDGSALVGEVRDLLAEGSKGSDHDVLEQTDDNLAELADLETGRLGVPLAERLLQIDIRRDQLLAELLRDAGKSLLERRARLRRTRIGPRCS